MKDFVILEKQLAIPKSFTLTVHSWENDGDDYQNHSITSESLDKIKALIHLCETIFIEHHYNDENEDLDYVGTGIGNMTQYDDHNGPPIILDYFDQYPYLIELEKIDKSNRNAIIQYCKKINKQLLGYTEGYYSRVFEKYTLTYSETDIFVNTIQLT